MLAEPNSEVSVISGFLISTHIKNSNFKEITEMAKQLNITEQEELFSTECKLINLKYEYQ